MDDGTMKFLWIWIRRRICLRTHISEPEDQLATLTTPSGQRKRQAVPKVASSVTSAMAFSLDLDFLVLFCGILGFYVLPFFWRSRICMSISGYFACNMVVFMNSWIFWQ